MTTPLHLAYLQATTATFLAIVACQIGTAFAARTEHTSIPMPVIVWGVGCTGPCSTGPTELSGPASGAVPGGPKVPSEAGIVPDNWVGRRLSASPAQVDRGGQQRDTHGETTRGMALMSELIVVGVDGSAEAAAALVYAATDATRRDARVRVVSVSQMPEYWAVPLGMAPPVVVAAPPDVVSVAQQVGKEAVDAFAAAHPALAGPVQMEIIGVSGHPATELVEQSRDADLLVLGHRGLGAFASTFLGSVGLNCVLHAHCPVTIVRPTVTQKTPVTVRAAAVSAV